MIEPDWYCDEVIPRAIDVDVVVETDQVLAFRPPVRGFGTDHVIVVPKRHVRSLLELDPALGALLLAVTQDVAGRLVDEHGGCQVLTTLGDEQHNRHLHLHVAVGEGVARFVSRHPAADSR
ncbi:HIT family protein [Nocardia asteroides]